MSVPLFYHILIPILAILVLSVVEWAADPDAEWRQRIVKVGFDLCVLATGMSGTFYHGNGVVNSHADLEIGLVTISILFSIGAAAVIIVFRRGDPSGIKALGSMALSSAAMSIPGYHALLLSAH